MSDKLYTVGKIVNTHGIKGELKVWLHTDFPQERFARGSSLMLVSPEEDRSIPVEVEASRPHKNVYILKLKQYQDIQDAEKLKGWMLKVSERFLEELPQGEYYHHEIRGCTVVTDEGDELGVISEILSPGANDVWVVERPKGKPVLLPVIDEVILHVDAAAKKVTVHLMEGLLP